MSNLSIVIPAAGTGKRMRTYGSKSLLQLKDGRTLLRKQLDTIKLSYPKSEIILVLGFDIDRVQKIVPSGIRIIENENYESTNTARSIGIGLRASNSKKNLVIYGDLIFNQPCIENLPNESCLIVDSKKKLNKSEVGITCENGYAIHLDFGLPLKWCSIMLLVGKELDLFKSISLLSDKKKLSSHEIINLIIEQGGLFKCLEPKKMKITEIDSSKDLSMVQ